MPIVNSEDISKIEEAAPKEFVSPADPIVQPNKLQKKSKVFCMHL